MLPLQAARSWRRTEVDCSQPRAVVFRISGENLSDMFADALGLLDSKLFFVTRLLLVMEWISVVKTTT